VATHDYVIANGTGAAVRSDLNNALAAIVSQNSSATEPSPTFAYMPWADTTAGVYKIRNGANNAWITLYQLDGEWSTIALENGTAAAPALYFKDSGTDTGIYSSGTDAVDIATAGVRRVGVSSTGDVTIYGQGDLRLADADSSNWVALQAPATVASNITWTLPATDGTADQAFATNGSGVLSWVSFLKASGGALTGDLTLNAQSDLRFADADSSNWVAFQAPATVTSNVTWTLPAADGTTGQVLSTNGTGTLSWATGGGVTMTRATAVATTSGTSIDFTGIPSTVKRITIMFDAVSTNGTSLKLIQLGDSGGIETTGYSAGVVDLQFYSNSSAGFLVNSYVGASTDATYGQITLMNLTGDTWTAAGGTHQTGYGAPCAFSGAKALSATLDRVRITTVNGTDTFDAGTVNIIYEG
jgi:hypothetical protein